MTLNDALVQRFAKATAPEKTEHKESTAYGTVTGVTAGGKTIYVLLDGGETPTPCAAGAAGKIGDRVIVTIKDRQATVTSNVSNPSTAQSQYNIFLVDRSVDPPETVEVCFMRVYYEDDVVRAESAEMFPKDDPNVRHQIHDLEIWPGSVVFRGYVTMYDGLSVIGDAYARSFNPTSDKRLKTWIDDTKINDALDRINKIKHREYYWKSDNKFTPIGYVAQELEEIDPRMVVHTKDDQYGFNSTYIQALMSKAIQELSAKVDDLERRLANVEAQNNSVSTEE